MTKVQALLVVFIVAFTAGFLSVGHFEPSAFGGFSQFADYGHFCTESSVVSAAGGRAH